MIHVGLRRDCSLAREFWRSLWFGREYCPSLPIVLWRYHWCAGRMTMQPRIQIDMGVSFKVRVRLVLLSDTLLINIECVVKSKCPL